MKQKDFETAKRLQKKIKTCSNAINELEGDMCIMIGTQMRLDADIEIHERLKKLMILELSIIKSELESEFEKI